MIKITSDLQNENYTKLHDAIKNIIEDAIKGVSSITGPYFQIKLKILLEQFWRSRECNDLLCPWNCLIEWKVIDKYSMSVQLSIKNFIEEKIDIITYNIEIKEGA